jgi:glycosyltransferase involved in cell wall biosynthesis
MNEAARTWCDLRTFDANSFDIAELIAAKESTRVSVVVPARDEAETIGAIVESIRDAHVIDSRLVDELLVIDSDSTDTTADVSLHAGATVYSAAQIRPDLGWRPGKGEAIAPGRATQPDRQRTPPRLRSANDPESAPASKLTCGAAYVNRMRRNEGVPP